VLDSDCRFHEEGMGPEATRSSPMNPISWNVSEMRISISSEGVVEVREAAEEEEVKESVYGWLETQRKGKGMYSFQNLNFLVTLGGQRTPHRRPGRGQPWLGPSRVEGAGLHRGHHGD